jgi:hypothetical protein
MVKKPKGGSRRDVSIRWISSSVEASHSGSASPWAWLLANYNGNWTQLTDRIGDFTSKFVLKSLKMRIIMDADTWAGFGWAVFCLDKEGVGDAPYDPDTGVAPASYEGFFRSMSQVDEKDVRIVPFGEHKLTSWVVFNGINKIIRLDSSEYEDEVDMYWHVHASTSGKNFRIYTSATVDLLA